MQPVISRDKHLPIYFDRLGLEPVLVGLRHVWWKIGKGSKQRARHRVVGDDAQHLGRDIAQDDLWLGDTGSHPVAQQKDVLIDQRARGAQAGEDVLVLLDCLMRHLLDDLRDVLLDAAELIDRE